MERPVTPCREPGRSGPPIVVRSNRAGQVVYLVLEDRREVHLLVVQWLG